MEHCDLCSAELPAEHAHLLRPAKRQLLCACEPCAVVLGNAAGAYRRIPRDTYPLPDFNMSDTDWDSLLIPVGMAYFYYSTPAERMLAFYPSPAGATESLLDLEAWEALRQANPVLTKMEPDVQALLVNRVRGVNEYYLTPIDKCYELVGLLRTHWRGLSGGNEVWARIAEFFGRLRTTTLTTEPPHA